MEGLLQQHEAAFAAEEAEPVQMTNAEMEEKGYYVKNGIMFDEYDQVLTMTKKELQKIVFKVNEEQLRVTDRIQGVEESVHM